MKMRRLVRASALWLGATVLAGSASADWATQSVTLHPGWNAVFVEVQPADNSCDNVFAGVPIKSLWKWNRKIQLKQFVKNPDELIPKSPDWLIYFPKHEARSFLSDLFAIQAGQPYLLELGGTEDVTLTLEGRVSTATPTWLPDSFNFVGFHLDPSVQPSFKDFLKYDPALAGQAVYRVTPDGKNVAVNTASEKLERGAAYWVYANGATVYAGPFSAASESQAGLNFGTEFGEGALVIANQSDQEKTITVRQLPSQRPPSNKGGTDLPPLAGEARLSYRKLIGWAPIEQQVTFTVPAKSTQRLPLALRRRDMHPLGSKAAVTGQFESVLQVTDGAGGQYNLGVSALADASPVGLWVGNVKLNQVSEVARPNDLTTTDASSAFNFRVIVHVDALGNATFLQKVYMVQAEQQVDNSVPPIVVHPEKYLLVTRDDLLDGLSGVSIRDGKFVGRRISAPAFSEIDLNNDGVADPLPMVGNVVPGQTATVSMTVDYRDKLNPFVHTFHPDHDNQDERYENPVAEGKESYTFTRNLTFSFETQDPDQLGLPEWGDTLLGGTYTEDITGLHKRPIRVQGTFRLTRVSRIDKLNDIP